jgi:hypothetical protein
VLLKRALGALVTVAFVLGSGPAGVEGQVLGTVAAPPRPSANAGTELYTLSLDHGRKATVFSSGIAKIVSKDRHKVEYRVLPGAFNRYLKDKPFATDRASAMADLMQTPLPAYVPNRVIVVFGSGVTAPQDVFKVAPSILASMRKSSSVIPSYSTDYTVNTAFARMGVDALERIGRGVSRGKLQAMRAMASARRTSSYTPLLDISNAFRVHLTASSVPAALRKLRALPGIAYVSPDFTVRTAHTASIPIPQSSQNAAILRRAMGALAAPSYNVPSNYAAAASAQPFLNATGVDAIGAFDEIYRRYGQLPGQGVTITNVSIGDLDDASVYQQWNDPCVNYEIFFGPTTRMINGQRYLDLPSMPLIPAYTAAADGTLSSNEVCGNDPQLEEIGMDFSVMAPLPHDRQRGENMGSGFTDLLGIAPGASYRLVVPQATHPATSDLIAAFLAAANQTPAPDIITASLNFSMDAYGFPDRYFEDDALVNSTISQIVNSQNIVFVLSANDGLRTYTNASVGPSGGSTATNVVSDASQTTALGDVAFSTAPSAVTDSGAIDAGSSTLDDITSNLRTVPETRFNGFNAFSSGFGSRVNVSAPGDNIVALIHGNNKRATDAEPVLSGGTSASAPEIAAAAAVLIQVARLTGHPFAKATDVRALLEQTANPVSQSPQTDRDLNVGPQIDVTRAVEKLLAATGIPVKPAVPRVAIMHRQGGAFNLRGMLDSQFVENTDPAFIDLQGPIDPYTMQNSGENAQSYITIAPDWEALPANAQFSLSVTGTGKVLATTPSARLLPAQILQAAGLTLASPSQRTINLTYRAYAGLHTIVTTSFQLTFGPAAATSELVLAPSVSPVVTGPVMTVTYDLSSYPAGMLADPAVIVSFPGRINPVTGNMFFASYHVDIPAGSTKGSVNIPVTALKGDGMYGVGLLLNDRTWTTSDFAPVRVSVAGATRPAAPVFLTQDPSTGLQVRSHYLEMPYNGSFTLAYDVSNVPNATGALLEISAAGSNLFGNNNTFNNPNGTVADSNGYDTGSAYRQVLYGTKGQLTLKASDAHLIASMGQTVRVIPLNGAVAAGEGSDVSYIKEDGVVPSDGGSLTGGYGINPSGNDGLLTSYQWTSGGDILKSVQTFAQDTLAAGATIASSDSDCTEYSIPGNAIFGGDAALVATQPDQHCPMTFADALSNIPQVSGASGLGLAAAPPFPDSASGISDSSSISGAPSGNAAFLVQDGGNISGGGDGNTVTFVGDVSKNTFGTPINLDSLNLVPNPVYGPMDYDSANGLGYIAVDQSAWFGWTYPTSILVTDYNAGSASVFAVNGCGAAVDFEIDPAMHLGALTENAIGCDQSNEFQLVDLNAKTARSYNLPGAMYGIMPGPLSVDPVNHLVFVEAPVSPDAGYNNNALSSVLVLDESGNQRAAIEQFNFSSFEAPNHYFVVNSALRRGYVFGPGFSQIQPFSY